MQDFLGEKIEIGDIIAYTRGDCVNLFKGIIKGFTPKGMKIEDDTGRNMGTVFSYQIVKLKKGEI